MAWTWTGYDHDAVHRFKEENFFQTGRNLAEDRFWKTQIHRSDRRGTQSSISLGETNSVSSNGHHFHYSYSEPRERSNSVISTISSRMKQFGPSRDYPYCYPEEISESGEEEKAEGDEESKDATSMKGKKEEEKEEDAKEEDEVKDEDGAPQGESAGKECQCSSGSSEERSPSPVKEEKEATTVKTEEDDKNYKSNSIKISTQKNHIMAEKHISSRFY